jgi:hypothetical protein
MLADVVEASSKSLADPSTENLKASVGRWINQILSEGQLDDCDLTLRELNLIAGAFVRTLDGIYRARPQDAGGASRPSEPSRPVSVVIGGKNPAAKVGRPA